MASSNDPTGIVTDLITAALKSFLESTAGEALSCLWDQTGGPFFSMIILSSKANDLRRETGYLTNRKEDIQEEIKRGTRDNKNPTRSAKTWLEEVDKVEIAEKKFQESFEKSSCCFLWLYFFLASDVQKLLKEVNRLKTQATDLTVLCEAMPNPVLLQSASTFSVAGRENIFKELREWLYDEDDSEIIGIYGMGGVGKTTLLKAINNELPHAESGGFYPVIFVTVSKEVSIDRIQKEIGRRLGYGPEFSDQDTGERATRLLNDLSTKKFILLLDDLWAELKLGEVGVPLSPISRKGSKVAITTRSAEVCNKMGAAGRKVKVPVLSREESWDLFCKSMGKREEKMAESIIPLAKATAKKCGGLPLAIIVVGRAMADVHSTGGWEEALAALPEVVEGMTDEVLPTLKFSFDRLNEIQKECLLYCSLFPEDYDIEVRDLIDLWFGEGFFKSGSFPLRLHRARNRSEIVISDLKAACLLEDSERSEGDLWYMQAYLEDDELGDAVKLHDVVRDMARRITNGYCEKGRSIFLSNSGEGLDCVPMPEKWSDATRISLVKTRINELPEIPKCENLRTLLLMRNEFLKQIHSEFFQSTPFLTVLDLSYTKIRVLPSEIGLLVELQYLNLSSTLLKLLPKEIGRLKKLKVLNLTRMKKLRRIPEAAILPLSCLQLLKIKGACRFWSEEDRMASLKIMDGLTHLEELDEVYIDSHKIWLDVLGSRRLCPLIKSLHLKHLNSISSIDLSRDLGIPCRLAKVKIDLCSNLDQLIFPLYGNMKLKDLDLFNLPLERISFSDDNVPETSSAKGGACFQNLKILTISSCHKLQEITWIRELPCLERLRLTECAAMVEIIRNAESDMNSIMEERNPSFQRLREITLGGMDNLMISWQDLLFPSLESLWLHRCPKLKSLPFGHHSAKTMGTLYLSTLEGITCIDLSRGLWTPNKLDISNCSNLDQVIFPVSKNMKLEELRLRYLPLERISFSDDNVLVTSPVKGGACFQNLKTLRIYNCGKLQEISWIRELPCLEILHVLDCPAMVEIIRNEESDMNTIMEERDPSFPRLQIIHLFRMENLKSISRQDLLFPSLHWLFVGNCPNLKRLPFGRLSGKNIETIKGESQWWDALEWSDQSILSIFAPFFKPQPPVLPNDACTREYIDEEYDELSDASTDEYIDEEYDELSDASTDEYIDDEADDEFEKIAEENRGDEQNRVEDEQSRERKRRRIS